MGFLHGHYFLIFMFRVIVCQNSCAASVGAMRAQYMRAAAAVGISVLHALYGEIIP